MRAQTQAPISPPRGPQQQRHRGWSALRWWLAGVLLMALAIQLVPYGHNHTNPPVGVEPAWPSAQARQLVVRTCFDCHSNQTTWPWYANVAPVSWLIQRDVDAGRAHLNFSQWNGPREGGVAEPVQEGSMPPWYYTLLHPGAHLSPAETQALVRALAGLR